MSDEQQAVLNLIASGKNVFFTGSAGTGKSFLLASVVEQSKRMYGAESVYVTASTGIAAVAIGGTTIHSYAGIGLGKESAKELAEKVTGSQRSSNRWRLTRVLIVDEVSMLSGDLLDKLEYIARVARGKFNVPFGAIQVVLCGDFFQLPPVNPGSARAFCFNAECWDRVFDVCVELRHVFRQKDARFVKVLNEIRMGELTDEALALLTGPACGGLLRDDSSGIEPTVLYARNLDVDKINMERLEALDGASSVSYKAVDTGEPSFLGPCQALAVLHLKIGAQVVLLKNLVPEMGLVNGSRGVVIAFDNFDDAAQRGEQCPIVRFVGPTGSTIDQRLERESWKVEVGGKCVATRSQIPVKLAFALSIHKSQGMSISRLRVDLRGVFEYGQTYVALSRATSLEGLHVDSLTKASVRAHPSVVEFYKKLVTMDTLSKRGR